MKPKNLISVPLPHAVIEKLGFRTHPGYTQPFTRQQAPGALPNETRIEKAILEEGDQHRVGARGTILGSIRNPDITDPDRAIGYFVEFDDMPGVPVFCMGWKMRVLNG